MKIHGFNLLQYFMPYGQATLSDFLAEYVFVLIGGIPRSGSSIVETMSSNATNSP